MSVLVTGGAGYIGSHTVLELLDAGETVVVLDNLSTGFASAVPQNVELVVGDIGDQPLLERLLAAHKIDAVLHFAGSIVVPESVRDPLAYYLNNTVKSRTLIAAAVAQNVPHIIFSSTAAVYGTPSRSLVHEDDPLRPISPYGTSKLMTEWMLADAAAAYPLRYTALRYFNVAGADPKGRAGQSTPEATHLIKVACQAALGQRPMLQIFGTDYATPDGTCVRDYIHVSDLARAHVAALARLRAGGSSRVFNCGYGKGASVRDVIDAVKRASGRDFKVVESPRRPGDPASLVADVARIGSELDWRARHANLDEIVGQALAWERMLGNRALAS